MLHALGPVVAVAEAHPAAFFPGMRGFGHTGSVFGGPITAVLVPRLASPAIVYHDLLLHRRLIVEPCQQLRATPFVRSHLPLAVAENYGRLVARHHVLE